MNNDFVSNQYSRYRCMGDCANCPFFSRTTHISPNSMLDSNDMKQVDDFLRQLPQTIFWQDNTGICYTRYEWLQDCLMNYCRKMYPWYMPVYMETDRGQVVYISDIYSYENNIKEIFKKAIEIAAEVTKEKNPQLSIMFDGIGLILTDDVKEAIEKVFSILDKASNPIGDMR